MSEELQRPPVIDVDALLQPFEGENPSGESLRYSGIYDEISESRRADDVLDRGDWQSELKVADFRRVIELAVPALETKSKDLQIAVWLSEALTKEYGFAGLRDGLNLVIGLQENFWDTLHPEIDEGDMESRANAIAWLDLKGAFAIQQAPITAGAGYSYFDWDDSKRFEIPDNFESLEGEQQQKYADLKEQAERERRVTADMWRKAKSQTRRQFCEEVNYIVGECLAAFDNLNRVIEEKYDRNQMPGLTNLKKAMDDVQTQVKRLLDEKRLEEPDENDAFEETSEAGENGDGQVISTGGSASSGAINGRRDALKRLGEIAAFFQRTEPHSPVAYLVQRAVKWGNMPLENWLQDVIKDETILFQIRETLGLANAASDSYGSGDSYAEETTEESSY
ncbi:MAG: type VI secretion system protein TssA [Saprospiraceae bacterium]|nr:type VI secretion system protein TssA [Pyrinomonadaceae bacterium]